MAMSDDARRWLYVRHWTASYVRASGTKETIVATFPVWATSKVLMPSSAGTAGVHRMWQGNSTLYLKGEDQTIVETAYIEVYAPLDGSAALLRIDFLGLHAVYKKLDGQPPQKMAFPANYNATFDELDPEPIEIKAEASADHGIRTLDLWINAFIPSVIPNLTRIVPPGKYGGMSMIPGPPSER
jgi:hypothetical protein